MEISRHAYERAEERLKLGKEAFNGLVEKVLESGISHGDLKGRLKKYIDSLFFVKQRKGSNIKLYGEFVYIFQGEYLITVFELPNKHKNYKVYVKD